MTIGKVKFSGFSYVIDVINNQSVDEQINFLWLQDYAGQTVSVFSYATVTVGTNSTYIVDTVMGNNKADVSLFLSLFLVEPLCLG